MSTLLSLLRLAGCDLMVWFRIRGMRGRSLEAFALE